MNSSTNPATHAIVSRVLIALSELDPDEARMAIAEALSDPKGAKLLNFADAVIGAASEIEENDSISAATWDQLADAVGSGPLRELVEQARR